MAIGATLRAVGVAAAILAGALVPGFSLGGCSMTHTQTDAERNAAILAAVLAHPQLNKYYHRDTQPDRFPLQVVNEAGVELAEIDAAAAGVPAAVAASAEQAESGRAPLIVDTIAVSGSGAEVGFTFPPEGISGVATLVLDGSAWRVTAMRLTER